MTLSSPSTTLTTVELVTVILSAGIVVLLVVVAYRFILHLKKKRQRKDEQLDTNAHCVDNAPLEEVKVDPHPMARSLLAKDTLTVNPTAFAIVGNENPAESIEAQEDTTSKREILLPLAQPIPPETAHVDDTRHTSLNPPNTHLADTSPSTARLEDYMHDDSVSLFSFFKGHRTTTTQSSSSAPGSLTLHPPVKMPALTRTQARSATRPPLLTHNSTSIIETRPTMVGSGRWLSGSKNTDKSNLRPIALQASGAPMVVAESHGVALPIPTSPSTVIDLPIVRSCTSSTSTSTLSLPQHHNVRESSSVMALYGSPNPSPSGSAVDVASVQALYCRSLRSIAASTTTYTQDDTSSVHENHE